jgi:hypothetical protein
LPKIFGGHFHFLALFKLPQVGGTPQGWWNKASRDRARRLLDDGGMNQ